MYSLHPKDQLLVCVCGLKPTDGVANVLATIRQLILDPRCRRDVNVSTKRLHGTPLTSAAFSGNQDVVKFLLTRPDIDVNKKDGFGQDALYYSKQNGHHKIVELLLQDHRIEKESLRQRMPEIPTDLRSKLHEKNEQSKQVAKIEVFEIDSDEDFDDFV